MDGAGLIRDKLDLKILILFILARLPDAVDMGLLSELVIFDEDITYFDYAECLSELVDTGHVEEEIGGYIITEKGRRNGETIASSLPYSVRVGAERRAMEQAAAMRRGASIRTSHSAVEGGCQVCLSMTDGVGEIISLRALCAGEDQAVAIERSFRRSAERQYNKIMEILMGE